MDIDVARERHLKLAVQFDLLPALKATKLPFVEVPGLSPRSPPTPAKLRSSFVAAPSALRRTIGAGLSFLAKEFKSRQPEIHEALSSLMAAVRR